MGMDWLDITFRIRKSFGIKIRKGDLERFVALPTSPTRIGIRCCDLHEMVLKLYADQGVRIPKNLIHHALRTNSDLSPIAPMPSILQSMS